MKCAIVFLLFFYVIKMVYLVEQSLGAARVSTAGILSVSSLREAQLVSSKSNSELLEEFSRNESFLVSTVTSPTNIHEMSVSVNNKEAIVVSSTWYYRYKVLLLQLHPKSDQNLERGESFSDLACYCHQGVICIL